MFKLFILIVITIASSQALPSLLKNTIERVIACESGPNELVTLRCPEGYTVYVISASYGRTDPYTCRYDPTNTNCYSNQIGYAKNLCDHRTQCALQAHNDLFGDPCRNTFKYLAVQYFCTVNAYPIG